MIKKILPTAIIWLTITSAQAAVFYVAPVAVWDSFYLNPIRYEGLSPKLSIGVSPTVYSQYAISFEGWVDPIKPFTHTNNTFGIVSLKPSYSYGLSLLPGYNLDDVLRVYLRLGVLGTKFDDIGDTGVAWQAGAGLQVSWSCTSPWSIRGEWNYAKYRSISGVGVIADGQYSLGFVYRFV